MSNKKVLFVATSDLAGRSGHNIATREMAEAFSEHQGAETVVIAPYSKSSNRRLDVPPSYTIPAEGESITSHILTELSLFMILLRSLLVDRPGVMVARLSPSLVVPPLLSTIFRVHYSLQIRGDVTREMRFSSIVWSVVHLNVYLANSIVVETSHLQNKLCIHARSGVPIAIFNSAVAPEKFQPWPKSLVRTEFVPPIDSETFIIGFVGSLKQRHMLSVLLKAVASIVDNHPDVLVLIVGDGPQREELSQLVKQLGLKGHVRFEGFIEHDEVDRYLAGMDILYGIIDPVRKTNPLKCYEAFACETPVITSDEPEMEFVDNNNAGFVINDISQRTITEAIERAIRLPNSELEAMGIRGKEHVLRNHTWDSLPDIVLKLVDEA